MTAKNGSGVRVIFDTGNCKALVPGYSEAPTCSVVLLETLARVTIWDLTLHRHGVGLASPNGSLICYIEPDTGLRYLWRAGEVLKKLGPYEPITLEVIGECIAAARADQDPENIHAAPRIKWATDRIGAGAYREVMSLPVPANILRADEKHRAITNAAIAKRDKHAFKGPMSFRG